MLKLDKPLAFIDLETTGINLSSDRIVEISILKILPDGSQQSKTMRINPEMHIPEASSVFHGIFDADVKDSPKFKDVAIELRDFLNNCDLAGYNSNKFDIPMLAEEFLRADTGFDENRRYIDVMRIFTLMEKEPWRLLTSFFATRS